MKGILVTILLIMTMIPMILQGDMELMLLGLLVPRMRILGLLPMSV